MITVSGTGDARVVAGGIFRALVTTAGGLGVGIAGLAAHALLSRARGRTLGDARGTRRRALRVRASPGRDRPVRARSGRDGGRMKFRAATRDDEWDAAGAAARRRVPAPDLLRRDDVLRREPSPARSPRSELGGARRGIGPSDRDRRSRRPRRRGRADRSRGVGAAPGRGACGRACDRDPGRPHDRTRSLRRRTRSRTGDRNRGDRDRGGCGRDRRRSPRPAESPGSPAEN